MLILLIGHSGQVGHELLPRLSALGDVLAPGSDELDLRDPDASSSWIRTRGPDVIVNAAAWTDVDGAESDEAAAHALNATAVGAIGAVANDIGAAVVHYSTDYVFDGTATKPVPPDAPTAPLGAYGRTKLAGERLALSGARALLLRTAWVYSPRRRNFLRTIERLTAERDELRIVDDQFGTPTPAALIASATVAAIPIWLGRSSAGIETHHLVCRGSTSWCGFARAIVAARPDDQRPEVVAIPTSAFPTPARRPAHSVLDPTSFESAFDQELPEWDNAFRTMTASR